LERLDLQLCSGDAMSGGDRLIRGRLSFDESTLGEIPFDDEPEPSPR
jgi:CPA2 family monovalent cation:H+ antiporter-2/glutathione-regulated potassium-efflux system protein KefB